MILEGLNFQHRTVTREHIERMTRRELVEFLEFRGTACYDDESTALLRECALDDFDCENIPEFF
jgi:hypothetical protein